MGEAKRKQASSAQLHCAAARVSSALRRLANAASGHLGADCYLHAELGARLMEDLGVVCERRSGYAAWRVGPGDGDVIAHTDRTAVSFLPPDARGFAYHTWLELPGYILDFTTYQLAQKAQELDAADGGRTNVTWTPDFLLLSKHSLRTYRQVAQSEKPPACHYLSVPAIDDFLASEAPPVDEAGLAAARLLLAHPDARALGPNDFARLDGHTPEEHR